ncbi:hypothetical protein GF359_04885 [candidate division WOR-3 bacterium]|uniref:ResB-like domain-containing protein n=1 Tax=candidate division WOR-3 bacterium TaxID=2052148 RepID=A0A9D5QDY5_UNCW3|nr:hypothetical protein [candidate division WOR-3 bacterium]MBD3364530.1 hypothetical protein [candidate division WOR-3 bacterium]
MKTVKDKPARKRPNRITSLFVIPVLAAFILMGVAAFVTGNVSVIVFGTGLGLLSLLLLFILARRFVLGPRRQSGWGIAEPASRVRKMDWKDVAGYAAGSAVILGILTICVAAGWHRVFGTEENLTLTEGGRYTSPLDETDSLELVRVKEIIYPDSRGRAVNNYQAVIVTSVEGEFAWDTTEVRVNHPLRSGNKRYYYLSSSTNPDSFYLHFDVKYPEGYILPFEFPPDTTKVMEPDIYLPFVFSFDYFRIDRTHLVDVPEVKLNVLLPGEMLASRVLRAPDSLEVEGHIIYFPYIRMRQTADLFCVTDDSWMLAASGCILLLLGLVAGFISRITEGFGGKK